MDRYWLDYEDYEKEWQPDIKYEIQQRDELLYKSLKKLTYDERFILELNFGLMGDISLSLEHIGIIYDLSSHAIRQRRIKAINKLRYLNRDGSLEELYRSTLSY